MAEPRRSPPASRARVDAVRALAATQHGILTRPQLLRLGMSTSAIGRAAHSGRLHVVHRGVYAALAPELLSEEGELFAALAAGGRASLLARGTAAWRARLVPARPARIELLSPSAHRGLTGVLFLRASRLHPGDVVLDAPFPITSVPRTLLDLAVHYEPKPLGRALAEAEFRYDLRPADVLATLRRGHPGSAALRAALGAHAPGHGEVKSGLERRFRRLLVERAIPLPERNVWVGGWEVDCLWRDLRVAVELDGRQHERPHQAGLDDTRDLELRSQGFVLRRYGTAHVRDRADDVVADLRAAFAEARLRAPGKRAEGDAVPA